MIILIKNYLSMTPIWKSTIKDCANLRKSFEMHAHPQYNSYPPNEPTSTYSEQRGDWSRCPTCWRRRWASWGPGEGPCSCCVASTCTRTPHTPPPGWKQKNLFCLNSLRSIQHCLGFITAVSLIHQLSKFISRSSLSLQATKCFPHLSQLWGTTELDLVCCPVSIIMKGLLLPFGLNPWLSDSESYARSTEIKNFKILSCF